MFPYLIPLKMTLGTISVHYRTRPRLGKSEIRCPVSRGREVLKPSAPFADSDASGDGPQHYSPIAGALGELPIVSHGLGIP